MHLCVLTDSLITLYLGLFFHSRCKGLLSFLNLWDDLFHQFYNVQLLFIQIFLMLHFFSFYDSNYKYVRLLNITLQFLDAFFFTFFFLIFGFVWVLSVSLKFMEPFLAVSSLLLSSFNDIISLNCILIPCFFVLLFLFGSFL